MKRLIKIKDLTFNVSNSVFNAIAENNLDSQAITNKREQVYFLDDSCLSSFLVIPTTSSTHFFIRIQEGVKLRVNKIFFDLIVFCSKQHDFEKTQDTKMLILHPLGKRNINKTITTPLN